MSDDLISRETLLEEIQSFRCSITGLRAGKGVLARAADEYQKSILQIIEDQPIALKKKKAEWIPIEEGTPESYSTRLFVTIEVDKRRMVIKASYEYGEWLHRFGRQLIKEKIVAWMPEDYPEPYCLERT